MGIFPNKLNHGAKLQKKSHICKFLWDFFDELYSIVAMNQLNGFLDNIIFVGTCHRH